jgi:ABC-2 type transport system permease protein
MNVWLIIRREFHTRVRTRGFIGATVIGLVAIVALNVAPALLESMFGGKQLKIAVVDTGSAAEGAETLLARLQAELPDTLPSGQRRFVLTNAAGDRAALEQQLRSGAINAYLVVPPESPRGQSQSPSSAPARYEFVALDSPGTIDQSRLSAALNSATVYLRLRAQGLTAADVQAAFVPVQLDARSLDAGAAAGEVSGATWGLTYVLVILLYMTIAIYGTYVAMGVIEEKSTRVVEILISTTRPFQLMVGKVVGIGIVALVQYALWIGTGLLLMAARGSLGALEVGSLSLTLSGIDPWLLVAFVVCFILGFFAYAALFAAGGSLVSRSEDAQQITGPLTIILVVVFFIAIYAMEHPDGGVTQILSMVPFVSPIVMFVRLAMGAPAAWQVALATVLQVAAIVGSLWVAGRIFRAGVLLYGKRLSLSVVARALR